MSNTSEAIGAIVVKVGVDKLDELLGTWTGGIALLLSPQGVVFAASRNDWLYRVTADVGSKRIEDIRRAKQFGKTFDQISPVPLAFTLAVPETSIDGVRYAVRSVSLDWNDPAGDWMLTFLEKALPLVGQLERRGHCTPRGLDTWPWHCSGSIAWRATHSC